MSALDKLVVAAEGWVVVLYRDNAEFDIAWGESHLGRERYAMHRGLGDGMHWKDAEAYAEAVLVRDGERVFVTTQNPSVLDCMCFRSAQEVRERVLLVRGGRIVNMTEERAVCFYDSYEVGIQYVSEILKTSGLW